MPFQLDRFDLDAFVRSTLAEDLGERGDITCSAVIPEDAVFSGVMPVSYTHLTLPTTERV